MSVFKAWAKSFKLKKGLATMLTLIILSLALAACGINPNANQTSVAQTVGAVTPALALPPITVSLDTPTPALTSTPTLVNTPSAVATPASSPQPNLTATKAATATSGPTLTPTPSGTAEKLDREAELKLVRAAYDALLKHLFREPDTATLLKAGLEELSSVTGVAPPEVTFAREAEANWNIFKDAYNKTLDLAQAQNFKYPKNQLGHRLVNAMAQAVNDEHTYFLDNSGYQSRQRLLQGDNSAVGFGVSVTVQDEKPYIIRVVPGSPADKSGLKAGDELARYDDTPINGKNWQVVREAKEDETHNFTVARPGQANPLTFAIAKKRYVIPTVEYQLINGHVGYIAIREFFTNVADKTNIAMVELKAQGADSWIIDVRNNPGGVAVDQVVGRFVAGGEVMGYNLDRKGREPLKVSNAGVSGGYQGKPLTPLLPIVILINGGSASSSEILALAVRDFGLGTVIGEKTAGALGHTAAYSLGDGTAISITVDEYESKSGAKQNGTGVLPDIEVGRSIEDLVVGRDLQLKTGIEQLEKVLARKQG